jgi:hypothetical protein
MAFSSVKQIVISGERLRAAAVADKIYDRFPVAVTIL